MDMAAARLGIDPRDIRAAQSRSARGVSLQGRLRHRLGPLRLPRMPRAPPASAIGYDDLRRRQAEARAAGRWFGIGIACYAELTGIGSRISVAPGMPINTGTETATIRIDSDRRGHRGVRHRLARPGPGDHARAGRRRASRRARRGHPHRARRQRRRAGRHRHLCEPQHRAGGRRRAARGRSRAREGAQRRLASARSRRRPTSSPSDGRDHRRRHRSLGDVPRGRARGLFRDGPPAAGGARRARRDQDLRSGVRHHHVARPTSRRWRSIPQTYQVRFDRFVVAEDCGRIINPLIVDGQVHGGVAQGIGAALYEEVVYDDEGQIHTASLVDYLVPAASEIPADAGRASRERIADHARRLSRHGRGRHHRRAGGGRQRDRRCAVAARHRDQRASGDAGAPVPPDRGGEGQS